MTEREEDRGLAWEQFHGLNEEFYTSKAGPADYIQHRLRALLLATSDSPLIAQAASEGFLIGELKISYQDDDDAPTADDHQNFLATESSVLLHHAGEALLRLYLAHADLPPCPWLEAARLRSFWAFKAGIRRLAESLDQVETQESLMDVFTGVPSPAKRPNVVAADDWTTQRDGLVALIAEVAELLLRDGPLYNAAKHGLAIIPGEAAIRFDFPEDVGLDLSAQGRSLRYLQAVEGNDRKRWQQTIAWTSVESNLSLTYVIAKQIDSLMNVARARYLKVGPYQVSPISVEMVETVIKAGWPEKPVLIRTMGQQLLYYAEPGEAGASAPLT